MIAKICKRRVKELATLIAVTVSVTALNITSLAAPVVMPDGSFFDAEYYAANNPDVVAAYGSDNADFMYEHYITYGKKEGRLPYAGADKTVAPVQPPQSSTVTIPGLGVPKIPNGSRTTSTDASAYFARSVFVGDSVLAGYRNYLAKQKSSPVSSGIFLAAASYSAAHALNEKDSLHPIYKGKKQPVWTAISQMDVDRIFIMFGTNDLVVKDAAPASDDVLALVDKIRQYNPGKEIHIISMSPVYAGTSKGAMNNPTIKIYNQLLLQGAMERGVYYLDLNSHLLNSNGDLIPKYCSDRYVHQTYASYSEVWDPLFTSYALGE
ncbi:MAG: SGNH/GDSL hydrolase family protein [Lachnospiraceae bacterium]|nr:SGNH/GDSL hydrolase family protein [Lachnospiraceae bacterium]